MELDFLNTGFDFPAHDEFTHDSGPLSDGSTHESKIPSLFANDYSFDYSDITPPTTMHSSFSIDESDTRRHSMHSDAKFSPEHTSLHSALTSDMFAMQEYPFMVNGEQSFTSQPQYTPHYTGIYPQMYQNIDQQLYYLPVQKRRPSVAFNPMAQPTSFGSILLASFDCDSCPAKFKRNAELRRHVTSIHSHMKTFICSNCNTGFGRKDALKRHMTSRIVGKQCAGSRRRSSTHQHDAPFMPVMSVNMNYV